MAEELHPDVIIMDIAMPNLNGIDATAQMLKRDPQLQRALDLLKAMKILDKTRPGSTGPQAQVR